MKIHILSIYVRGIINDTKVGIIRDYTSDLSPIVDVLCLQKRKLRGDKVEKKLDCYGRAETFSPL